MILSELRESVVKSWWGLAVLAMAHGSGTIAKTVAVVQSSMRAMARFGSSHRPTSGRREGFARSIP